MILFLVLRRYCQNRCSPSLAFTPVTAAWTTSSRNVAFSSQLNHRMRSSLCSNAPRTSEVSRKAVFPTFRKGNIHRNVSSSDASSENGSYGRPVVQWYPGHIAKAERELAVTLKAVDVVVEVRDARIPAATAHPNVLAWCRNKPRVVALTHADAIPRRAHEAWQTALRVANRIDSTASTTTTTEEEDGSQLALEHKNSTAVKLLRLDENSPNPNQLIQNVAAQVESVRIHYNPGNASVTAKKRVRSSSSSSSFQPQFSNTASAVCFVNAKEGAGVFRLIRAIGAAGQAVQDRRAARGLLGRPLRVGILGYPNVGKSALINRLIGRRRCRTANTPGVTRSLQWIRVKPGETGSSSNTKRFPEFEVLDSPGIIPAVLADQSDAMLLAACNCIGEASYDNQAVAAYLCEWLLAVHRLGYQQLVAPFWRNRCIARYDFDPLDPQPRDIHQQHERVTGEDILYLVADKTCLGNPEDASRKILQDFRSGRMGPFCLQVAPPVVDGALPNEVPVIQAASNAPDDIVWQIEKQKREQQALDAVAMAKERGLELPPALMQANATTILPDGKNQSSKPIASSLIGKGLFEGW